MTQLMPWEERFALGVPSMDGEHKELLRRMNDLYDLVGAGAPRPKVKAALEGLAEYTVDHFTHEEKHMEAIGFPGLASHKLIHAQLLERFGGHADAFARGEPLGDAFFRFLKVWLASHICGVDRKYSPKAKAA
ncbi:MAG: bacteriohemerythrin [Sandaracinaceae bacterium]